MAALPPSRPNRFPMAITAPSPWSSDGRLVTAARVPAPLAEVFAFFSEATNLERLTPSSLRFHILTPLPIAMHPGTLIDYRLGLFGGIPVRWQSEITVWEPPFRFVDEQRRGPYRRWRHEHRFRAEGGATVMEDEVAYAVPGGWLARRLFVEPQLRRIFTFRAAVLQRHFVERAAPESS